MDFLTQIVVWLNACANTIGGIVLMPIAWLPGWLSATLVAAITGVALLAVFKYTSNQAAIRRVQNSIKANLLALKLFQESTSVVLRAQGNILLGALRLALLAIVPMLIMTLPVLLVLGQLSLWYQSRALKAGEEAVVMMSLAGDAPLATVRLEPSPAVDVAVGPVRMPSEQRICWRIKARTLGNHRLVFHAGEQTADKELSVGDRFMRVSSVRHFLSCGDAVLYPAERPFERTSPIQSIAIDYPRRASWTSGADTWVVYWLVVSMATGFAFRRTLNVNM
jgi:uncharacterized membrane protein (DUF106 family)